MFSSAFSCWVKAPDAALWNSDILMGYRVRYRQEEDSASASEIWRYVYATGLNALVANLEAGSRYSSCVQAYNLMGGGPWSLPGLAYLEIGIGNTDVNLFMLFVNLLYIGITFFHCFVLIAFLFYFIQYVYNPHIFICLMFSLTCFYIASYC